MHRLQRAVAVPTRQRQLRAEFDGALMSLSLYLAGLFLTAVQNLPTGSTVVQRPSLITLSYPGTRTASMR